MTQDRFIAKGAASFNISYDAPPKDFYFLLLPKLTMLAFSAAVEPLRIANQVTKKNLYRWYTMTEDGEPISCSNGVRIIPDMALEPLPASANAFVCAGVEPRDAASDVTLNWLRRQRAFGSTVGGICTGAFPLAETGMLKNRRFTLHWENQPAFQEYYPDLEPTPNLYEVDDKLLTCGGGSAATDMMLGLIEADHGKDLAIIVADMCIHGRSGSQQAPQKSVFSVAIGSRNQRLINAIQIMQANIEDPMEISELSEQIDISRRQLERLFKTYVGMSPNQYYLDLRVARAHALLIETNLAISEIAVATGFGSTTQLAAKFRKKFGVSPQLFRKSWSTGS